MKNIDFFNYFLCYYHSKFFASEPFFIEEIEEYIENATERGSIDLSELTL